MLLCMMKGCRRDCKKGWLSLPVKAVPWRRQQGNATARDRRVCKNFCDRTGRAKQSFSDDAIYEHFITDRAILNFRFLQILMENANSHLSERDCSIQRNHQKMIEAQVQHYRQSFVKEWERRQYVQPRQRDYVNAGTIEFLLEQDGSFYFMEMNTRIQVEHPITEWITGIDQVKGRFRSLMERSFPIHRIR